MTDTKLSRLKRIPYGAEDLEELNRILGQQYHVVVGNPPYITVKDQGLNQAYRKRYTTDLPPCSEQVFSRNPLVLLTILCRQGSRPSAYIICKLLEPGRGVSKAFRMAACRASGDGRRVIAAPRTW